MLKNKVIKKGYKGHVGHGFWCDLKVSPSFIEVAIALPWYIINTSAPAKKV